MKTIILIFICAITLSAQNWTGTGNHSFSVTATDPIAGSYSGQIIATGIGDADSCVSLPNTNFTNQLPQHILPCLFNLMKKSVHGGLKVKIIEKLKMRKEQAEIC